MACISLVDFVIINGSSCSSRVHLIKRFSSKEKGIVTPFNPINGDIEQKIKGVGQCIHGNNGTDYSFFR